MDNIKPFNVTKTNPTYAVILIVGGDNDLNNYIEKDMQEMLAGMSDDMSVLCLVDYLYKPAKVVELTKAGGERLIDEWGELNTGDPKKLAEFLARALVTYSSDAKIAIGFWSHGSGVFSDSEENDSQLMARAMKESRVRRMRIQPLRPTKNIFFKYRKLSDRPVAMLHDMMHDVTSEDLLTNRETKQMLNLAFQQIGILGQKVKMIFSDTCLNGMVEMMHELKKYSEVIVASEDLEPGDGWDYKLWFKKMTEDPPTDSASWGKQAVAAFEESYKDKTDFHPCTLGAFTTDNSLAQAFKELIEAIDIHGRTGWYWMNDAREQTQSFSGYATYDLFHFTQNLLIVLDKYGVNAETVKEKAQTLADAFQKCRVHSVALGEKVRHHSHGLGFWFPYELRLFKRNMATYRSLSFDLDTGWTNYLKKHYLVE